MNDPRIRLQALAENHPRLAVRRRARIVLLTLDGWPTTRIASEVGLSIGQVRRLRNHWHTRGMEIFPEDPPLKDISAPKKSRRERPHEEAVTPTASAPSWVERLRTGLDAPSPIVFEAHAPMTVAGHAILRHHFGWMLKNEAGTCAGMDIEALHDMRVATRRMRAAVRIFTPFYRRKAVRNLRNPLRSAGHALGLVRDWDVFLANAARYQKNEAPKDDFEAVLADWRTQRDAAQTHLQAWLTGENYPRLVTRMAAFLEAQPGRKLPAASPSHVHTAVPGLIYACYGEMLAYEPLLPQASLIELHALRIAIKRVRYALEFFACVLGEETGAVISTLKALQDHLGALNDADVACQRITNMLTDWDKHQRTLPGTQPPPQRNPQAALAYLSYCYQQRQQLLASFPQTWHTLLTPEWKRTLALTIAAL
ncbi:MAG: hypothetical protein Fur0018_14170 [Anaerolineales bacterium]